MTRYVLLDRDGVINRCIAGGYVTSWEEFVFLPCALEALRLLHKSGFVAIVVSNQQGVGRGLMSHADLEDITTKLRSEVENHGGHIEAVYYCTHLESEGCECRKPKPGLLLQAQRDYGFDCPETYVIGDSRTDVLAAQAAGCPALLVGHRAKEASVEFPGLPHFASLYDAVGFLLGT